MSGDASNALSFRIHCHRATGQVRESRIVVCDPASIPLDEMQRTYCWFRSWNENEVVKLASELMRRENLTRYEGPHL